MNGQNQLAINVRVYFWTTSSSRLIIFSLFLCLNFFLFFFGHVWCGILSSPNWRSNLHPLHWNCSLNHWATKVVPRFLLFEILSSLGFQNTSLSCISSNIIDRFLLESFLLLPPYLPTLVVPHDSVLTTTFYLYSLPR